VRTRGFFLIQRARYEEFFLVSRFAVSGLLEERNGTFLGDTGGFQDWTMFGSCEASLLPLAA
jgi:hypothetical protein